MYAVVDFQFIQLKKIKFSENSSIIKCVMCDIISTVVVLRQPFNCFVCLVVD